jgi:hypothetical protein
MLLSDLPTRARTVLDEATSGLFTRMLDTYDEVHLTAQTHLDGLSLGEMKLYVTIINKGDTVDYAVAKLGGSAVLVGWEIYIGDKIASARATINAVVARQIHLH